MKSLVTTAKALGDLNRVRALWALRDHELCVCQIVELLGLAQSTVSKHLSILEQAGLIQTEKRSRWMYCRLTKPSERPEMRNLLAWMDKAAAPGGDVKKDQIVLKAILKKDPEELCKKQRKTK